MGKKHRNKNGRVVIAKNTDVLVDGEPVRAESLPPIETHENEAVVNSTDEMVRTIPGFKTLTESKLPDDIVEPTISKNEVPQQLAEMEKRRKRIRDRIPKYIPPPFNCAEGNPPPVCFRCVNNIYPLAQEWFVRDNRKNILRVMRGTEKGVRDCTSQQFGCVIDENKQDEHYPYAVKCPYDKCNVPVRTVYQMPIVHQPKPVIVSQK